VGGPPDESGTKGAEADLQVRLLRDTRARLFATIDAACEHGGRTQRDKDLGQADLFGGAPGLAPGANGLGAFVPRRDVPAWTEIEQLQYEKEALGLYWSGHPVDRFAAELREYGARSTADLGIRRDVGAEDEPIATNEAPQVAAGPSSTLPGGGRPDSARVAEQVSIGGIVTSLRPLKTRKGDRMCVFVLEDAHGSLEVVVFPEAFKQHGHLVEDGQMVLVNGRSERDEESSRLLAEEIAPLEIVRERLAKAVAIKLSAPRHDRETFVRLWDVLMQHKGDRRVTIELQEAERHLRIRIDVNAQIRVRPSERLVSEVEKICGAGSVSLR
jgi:DNA polymerase-3 subunit alpha